MIKETSFWVYILHCSNDCYYTGYTTDLARRFAEHVSGSAKCKYTRSFKPLKMAQCWAIAEDKVTAMKIEKFIKTLSRNKKLELIADPDHLMKYFQCKPLALDELNSYRSNPSL